MKFLIAALLLVAVSAHAQDLAEVAKAERERRAAMPSKARVVTNADLPVYPVAPRSEAILPFDVASFLPRVVAPRYDGPHAYIDSYDRWWPFDGPPKIPERVEHPVYTAYIGPPYYYPGAGLWNRGGSRGPREGGRREAVRTNRSHRR